MSRKKPKPIWERLTPTQQLSVEQAIKGNLLKLYKEIIKLQTTVGRFTMLAQRDNSLWANSMLKHYRMILDIMENYRDAILLKLTKGIKHARVSPSRTKNRKRKDR